MRRYTIGDSLMLANHAVQTAQLPSRLLEGLRPLPSDIMINGLRSFRRRRRKPEPLTARKGMGGGLSKGVCLVSASSDETIVGGAGKGDKYIFLCRRPAVQAQVRWQRRPATVVVDASLLTDNARQSAGPTRSSRPITSNNRVYPCHRWTRCFY